MVAFFTHRIYTPVDNKITVVIGQPKITPISHNQIYCTATYVITLTTLAALINLSTTHLKSVYKVLPCIHCLKEFTKTPQ